jgi:sugar phosphate permease
VSNDQLKLALKAKADLRRRWLYLMPIVFFTYSLAYLGRSNFGFGAAAGLAKSLNITESRAAFLGSVFFIGYFLFQIPAASYARRKSAARLVFFALLSWGILSGLTGIIHDYWLLVIDRTLLGVSESLIFPSMLILLTNWFTREERSRANAILILGNPVTVTWMAAVTGYLIKALGWQMTFIIEGIPSIIWAFVWIMVARDKPHQAAWLHKDSTKALEAALEAEQQELPKLGSFADALKVPAVILLCVQYFFWSFGVYGLVLWIPEMIRSGSKIGIETVGLLSAAPFLLGVLLMILVSNFSDRMMNRKLFVWPFLCISGLALFISFATAGQNFWIGYIALVIAGGTMYAPYGPFFAIVPEMLPSNVAGEVFALINSFGALGGFAGTWLVGLFQALTGNAKAGYFVMAASLLISGFIIMGLKTKKPVATA